jgi:hypothetical protein
MLRGLGWQAIFVGKCNELTKSEDRTERGRMPNERENGMRARIYKPAKNAMQSGRARTKSWLLEYEPETPRVPDPLMGWTSSNDMRQQVTLEFDTCEEAVAYAEKNAIPYQVFEPQLPTPKSKSYSDNFRFDRKVPWSH